MRTPPQLRFQRHAAAAARAAPPPGGGAAPPDPRPAALRPPGPRPAALRPVAAAAPAAALHLRPPPPPPRPSPPALRGEGLPPRAGRAPRGWASGPGLCGKQRPCSLRAPPPPPPYSPPPCLFQRGPRRGLSLWRRRVACPRPLSPPLLGWGRSQAPLPPGCPHQPRGGGGETQVSEAGVSEFSCHISGCCQVFDTLEGYEHHYNTLHRNVCSFCKRSFPSGHLLDIHILEWHDSLFQIMAEKQNMYKCLVEGCAEKFKSSKDRKDHLVTVHLYPADFRFDRPKKVKSFPAAFWLLPVVCAAKSLCLHAVTHRSWT
uniref:Zinc finger protein 511 n=1 Tax=Aquila chrysaetos chrysaetos TaxID=223781 RepID=A0A663DV15_AQUCH